MCYFGAFFIIEEETDKPRKRLMIPMILKGRYHEAKFDALTLLKLLLKSMKYQKKEHDVSSLCDTKNNAAKNESCEKSNRLS